ncbi:MAG TPA: DEAD/DEAH box helicase, partial [Polyangiaceae bacterium]
MEGELERAQSLLDESEAFRGRSSAVAMEETPAIVLALLAIQRGTPEALSIAKRLVRAGKRKVCGFVEGWPAAPTFAAASRAVRRLLQAIEEPRAERARLDVHQLPSPAPAWEVFVLGLAVLRESSSPLHRTAWAHRLVGASEAWQLAGYHWFAGQAFALAEALDAEVASTLEVPPRLARNEGAFAAVFQPEPDWRRSLRALAAFNSDAEQAAPAITRRVTWFVDMASGELAKPALEEFVRGRGWTRGRRLELSELFEIEASLPPEDALVVRAARAAPEQLAPLEALDALVGHSRVFNGARGRASVDVVRGTCRVEARAERSELVIRLEPASSSPGVHTVVVNDARLIVYRVSPAIAKLTALLPKNLRIPEAHVGEALPILAELGEHVEVLNTAIGTHRNTTADSTPCLRISPSAGAFSLELGVRPFGARGRFFPVGFGTRFVTAHQGLEVFEAARDFGEEVERARDLIQKTATLAASFAREAEDSDIEMPLGVTCSEEELFSVLVELREHGTPCELEWKNSRPIGSRGRVTRNTLRGTLRRIKGWYIVTGGVHIDAVTELALSELATMPFTQSGRFVRLPTGDFLEVEQKLRRAMALLVASAERHPGAPKRELRLPDAAFGALAPLLEAESGFAIDVSAQEWSDTVARAYAQEYPLPEGLCADLRPYQTDGYQWLRRSSALGLGVILADDMGLGKTLQVLALLLARAIEGPAIVVAPTSVCRNWLDEIGRFAPSLRALEFSGKDRRRLLARFAPGEPEQAPRGSLPDDARSSADILIVSYALLQQHADELAAVEWNTAVLDEAQFIKNDGSLRAKAAFRLRARYRLAMTGTPVENHLGDLWSIFHFLNPSLLGTAKNFELRYQKPIERDRDSEQHAALKHLVGPFILRRTKARVARELPALTVVRHEIRLTTDEAMRYALLRRRIHEKLHTPWGKRQHKFQAFPEIMRLRRFCCHPRLVFPDAPAESSKLDALVQLLEELRENGHRALVFSQFVDFLAIVREQLEERRIAYAYLDGATPREARHLRVKEFQEGRAEVFLISLKAGGFGLNLTAADYVIHVDPWWNPAVEAQATDRAHRIGQRRPVTVYRLVTKDTIEERIL